MHRFARVTCVFFNARPMAYGSSRSSPTNTPGQKAPAPLDPLVTFTEGNTAALKWTIFHGPTILQTTINTLVTQAAQIGDAETLCALATKYPYDVTVLKIEKAIHASPNKEKLTYEFLEANAAKRLPPSLKNLIDNDLNEETSTKIFSLGDTDKVAVFLKQCVSCPTAGSVTFMLRNDEEFDAFLAILEINYGGGSATLEGKNPSAYALLKGNPHFLDTLGEQLTFSGAMSHVKP